MELTQDQIDALLDARTRVTTCLGQLLGPDFDGRSGYYSDPEFVIDFATALGSDTAIITVDLLQKYNAVDPNTIDADGNATDVVGRTPISVLTDQAYHAGVWLEELERRASRAKATRDSSADPVILPGAFDPVDDAGIFGVE